LEDMAIEVTPRKISTSGRDLWRFPIKREQNGDVFVSYSE